MTAIFVYKKIISIGLTSIRNQTKKGGVMNKVSQLQLERMRYMSPSISRQSHQYMLLIIILD